MSSFYGESLKLSVFGQSHGPAIGMTLDGIPAGLPVDTEKLDTFLARRRPGTSRLTTARQEADRPEFLSGVADGFTCGAPITAVIYNSDSRSSDYQLTCPRPGHADFTAQIKYKGFQDASGGGHFSGRLTAPLCVAGGLCKSWLEARDIHINAKLLSVGPETDPALFDTAILAAKEAGDSLGGVIACAASGLPAGLGEPIFGGMENRIASVIFGIPGVKGLEFGSGFAGATWTGSLNNDPFIVQNGQFSLKTNHSGGILGGITTGMPLEFRVAVKPTPSIATAQESVNFETGMPEMISVSGRHDPCIALRAVPVVEAAAAIAIFDSILGQRSF